VKFVRRLPPFETLLVLLAVAVLSTVGVLREQHSTDLKSGFDSYSSFDVASGGYRAWYDILEREGRQLERLELRPAYLDAGLDTLIYAEPLPFDPSASGGQTPADVRALVDWVAAGGRLVYLGHDDDAAKTGTLKLPFTTKARAVGVVASSPTLRAAGIAKVAWAPKPLRWRKWPKNATVLASDVAGPLAVRYPYGHGELIAVVDETPFDNARIGRADNARFAYYLATPRRPGGRVAFDEQPHGFEVAAHWWQIVPRPLLVAICLAAFALLVAFAGAAIRLGPPLTAPRLRDPTSLEFLDSVAALLERGRGGGKALADALASTRRAAASAFGMPEDSPLPELAERIPRDDVRREFITVMSAERFTQPDDATLIRVVALAATLRKEFATHGSARR
jgi:hypothetical protein